MSSLWPINQRGGVENVLNGIALGKDHVLLTGKLWDRMYKVQFLDWPTLFDSAVQAVPDNGIVKEDPASVGEDTTDFLEKKEVEQLEEKEQEPTDDPMQNVIVNEFTVLQQIGHDRNSFTQGLSIGDDGTIYETTGLYRSSKVRRINPGTFEVDKSIDIGDQYFGEGSTFFRDADGLGRLIEITWKEQTGFIYDSETLEKVSEFKYTTTPENGNQGWGITYDPTRKEFVVSDGSKFLYFWDRDTLEEKRKIAVIRFDGREQSDLNELEYIDGLVCCNIWHNDHIICVNPDTGKSVREYDMSSLWPVDQRGGRENVLNGIALGEDHILLTGKRWDRMYKVKFPDWSIFAN